MISLLWGFCHRSGGGLMTFKGASFVFRSVVPALIIGSTFHLIWYLWLALIPAFYFGEMVGYSAHWNMGRGNKYTWLQDFVYMTLRGLWFTFLPGAVVAFQSWHYGVLLAVSGLVMGVAYELGWRCPQLGQEFNTGPEVAEFIFGILMGLIVSIGVLLNV